MLSRLTCFRWTVGNGNDIKFWGDKWVPNCEEGKVSLSPWLDCTWHKVSHKELQAILKAPISLTKAKDKLIWGLHKSGKYSVKYGYHSAHEAKVRRKIHHPSSSFCLSNKEWKKLWSIPTIPKVHHIVWKVARNWLATKENVFKKKCAPSPL